MAKPKRNKRHLEEENAHKIMVDTSALMALFNPEDQYHEEAISFRDNFILLYKVKLFTTNYIYSETMSHLTMLGPKVLKRLDHTIRTPPKDDPLGMTEIWVEKNIIPEAVQIYFKYLEHDFSITDCTTFVLMKKHNILAAFSFDDDYKVFKYQKGYGWRGFCKLPEMLTYYVGWPGII